MVCLFVCLFFPQTLYYSLLCVSCSRLFVCLFVCLLFVFPLNILPVCSNKDDNIYKGNTGASHYKYQKTQYILIK